MRGLIITVAVLLGIVITVGILSAVEQSQTDSRINANIQKEDNYLHCLRLQDGVPPKIAVAFCHRKTGY